MDPITAAANRFLREHETAWRAPPEQEPPAILRLHSEPSERRSVIKALRLLEWQPENRHPISIFEEPFEDMGKYLAAAIEHARRDVRLVDEGLIADGQPRRSLPAAPPISGPVEAVAHVEALGRHLAPFLAGLVLVLAPSRVLDRAAFAAMVGAMAKARDRRANLRLDVFAPAVPEIEEGLPATAHFIVDQRALLSHLRDLGQKPSKGPTPDDQPVLPPEKKKEIEAQLGQPLVSLDAGATLKTLLFDGGVALSEDRPKDALRKYRAARMLAEMTGLKREALLATMALGTCYATIQNHRGAEAAYRRARTIAQELERPDVEAQALLGLGFIAMREKRFDDARPHYEKIVQLLPAEHPLYKEALRLIVACRNKDVMHGAGPGARP